MEHQFSKVKKFLVLFNFMNVLKFVRTPEVSFHNEMQEFIRNKKPSGYLTERPQKLARNSRKVWHHGVTTPVRVVVLYIPDYFCCFLKDILLF